MMTIIYIRQSTKKRSHSIVVACLYFIGFRFYRLWNSLEGFRLPIHFIFIYFIQSKFVFSLSFIHSAKPCALSIFGLFTNYTWHSFWMKVKERRCFILRFIGSHRKTFFLKSAHQMRLQINRFRESTWERWKRSRYRILRRKKSVQRKSKP